MSERTPWRDLVTLADHKSTHIRRRPKMPQLHSSASPVEPAGRVFTHELTRHFIAQVKGQSTYGRRHATACPFIEIETFPKQAGMEGKELGNLMRLPLGIHRVSEERGFMVDTTEDITELEPLSDPLSALTMGNL